METLIHSDFVTYFAIMLLQLNHRNTRWNSKVETFEKSLLHGWFP
jgi:hypothetical protein